MAGPETSHYRKHFEEIRRLGVGGYGCVFKAKHLLDKTLYAVKKVRFPRDRQEEFVKEAEALARLNHPHIVRYFHVWREEWSKDDVRTDFPDSSDESENSEPGDQMKHLGIRGANAEVVPDKGIYEILYIQMELCTSSLDAWIDERNAKVSGSRLQENDGRTKEILKQILLALEHIHSQGIIHRDLKPVNIFIARCEDVLRFKIGDFGLCKLTQSQTPNPSGSPGAFGTAPYGAPEMKKRDDKGSNEGPQLLSALGEADDSGSPSHKVDIYSLGVIYLQLLVKIPTIHQLKEILDKVLEGQLPEELQGEEWATQVGLLRQMLKTDARDRSSATELLASPCMSQPCSDEEAAFHRREMALKETTSQRDNKGEVQTVQENSEETGSEATPDFLKEKQREEESATLASSSRQTAPHGI